MQASLRALLEGLIDYAGLFPPARLPLPEALAHYQRYRQCEDAWMLGRFICPASRLQELPEGDYICSALARGGETGEAFLAALDADLEAVRRSPVKVEVLEARLPDVAVLSETRRRVEALGLELFVETSPELHAEMIALKPPGFKLRCGGLDPRDFPSAEQIARVLQACHVAGVRFKATAGLHHPLPRPPMHGFVNLFVAGVLLQVQHIEKKRLIDLLKETDPEAFTFTDSELLWRDRRATTDEVRQVRRSAMLSFGSCSFDEPREDLQSLGWW